MTQIKLLLVIGAFFLSVGAEGQSWTNGLTSYYPLDGNVNDVVGGDNGTVSNAVSVSGSFPGQNYAYSFDGGESAIYVPAASLNNLAGGTISTWVELDRNTSETIFAKQDDGQNSVGIFTVGVYCTPGGGLAAGDPGRLYFHCENYAPLAASTSLLSTGVWHQVAVTFSTNSCSLFIDGAPAGTTSGDFGVPDNLSPTATTIGAWESNYSPDGYGSLASLNGIMEKFRIFNRALSTNEIVQMYTSDGGIAGPRTATAVAQVFNGFIVGVQIVDPGFGYTNVPSIRFIGVGSGAQATAAVSNSSVTAINVVNTGGGYDSNATLVVVGGPVFYNPVLGIAPMSFLSFSNLTVGGAYQLQQYINGNWTNQQASILATNTVYGQMFGGAVGSNMYRLAPYPVPVPAQAVAELANDFVVGAQMTFGGSGYVSSPAVTILGGGGTNAMAIAQISGGQVTNVMFIDAGFGYTSVPTIQIAAPPIPVISPQVQRMILINSSFLAPYENYQLQVSVGLGGTWAPIAGGSFLSTNSSNAQLFFTTNGTSLFRLQYLP